MSEEIKRSFYSDASHNYMVIACQEEMRDNYQYKMLVTNSIKGLLPCSSRSIDQKEYLYYDITSKQSLSDLYDRRRVRGTDLKKLLEDLVRMEETLTEYLLDSSHMILDPSCIYIGFREQDAWFAYYPGELKQEGWTQLFSFLADRVDGSDKQAAALAFRLCMMAEKPGFRIGRGLLDDLGLGQRTETADAARGQRGRFSAAEPFLYNESGEGRGTFPGAYGQTAGSEIREGEFGGRETDLQGLQGMNRPERMQAPSSLKKRKYEEASAGNTASGRSGRNGSGVYDQSLEEGLPEKKAGKGKPVLGAVLLAAGAALLAAGICGGLGERETLLLFSAGGLAAVMGILLLIIWLVRKRGQGGEEAADFEEKGALEDGAFEKGAFTPLWEPGAGSEPDRQRNDAFGTGKQRRWDYEEAPAVGFMPGDVRGAGVGTRLGPDAWGAGCGQPDAFGAAGAVPPRGFSPEVAEPGNRTVASIGETSLLSPGTEQAAGLYGTGTCRGERISLAVLPCVVGKVREYVDQVLDDGTVSRMHARFALGRDGEMTVRDLNSTNGTWLNGERLAPNESRPIRQGDHIRLGRMEFVYR